MVTSLHSRLWNGRGRTIASAFVSSTMCGRKRNVEDMMAHPKFGEQAVVPSTTRNENSNAQRKEPGKVTVERTILVSVKNKPEESDMYLPQSSRVSKRIPQPAVAKNPKRILVKQPIERGPDPSTRDNKMKNETTGLSSLKPSKRSKTESVLRPPSPFTIDRTQNHSERKIDSVSRTVSSDLGIDCSQESEGPASRAHRKKTGQSSSQKQTSVHATQKSMSSEQLETSKMSANDVSHRERIKEWFSKMLKRTRKTDPSTKDKGYPRDVCPTISNSCADTLETQTSIVGSRIRPPTE
uniref:ENHANCER OF AG-4 protein 2-like n=1 Tax=Steinernema glaseri TaxID=37863 RepID=A0A1I8AIA1_9BILA